MPTADVIEGPDRGQFTTLVNPAVPARVTKEQKKMAEIQKVPPPGGKRRRPRRRRNGAYEQLVALLIPAAAGGGIGYLEADPPEWWTKVDDGIKAAVLAAVAYVAEMKGMKEAAGGASAFAGFYATRRGLQWWKSRQANAAPEVGANRRRALGDLMAEQGLTYDDVNRELVNAVRMAEGQAVSGFLPAGETSELGSFTPADENLGALAPVFGGDEDHRFAAGSAVAPSI